jgi:exonuclease SbcD
MRFIHTSDWHLGRLFHNVSLLEDQRYVLSQLIALIAEHQVDAVVIAGDIYDRSVPPAAAVQLLDEVLHKICNELNTPVIMIPGNHDGAERLGFASRHLSQAGLHIISDLKQMTTPVTIGSVCFYGIPYNDPETVRHSFDTDVAGYDEAHAFLVDQIHQVKSADQRNVLISHCYLAGGEASESERPLSIGGAEQVSVESVQGFDYVALGHLHSPQSRGSDRIRYSGSLLKYSFSEVTQKKGVTLVELADGGAMTAQHLDLKPLREMRVIEGEINEVIEVGKVASYREDYLLVRLTDRHAILDAMGKLRVVFPNILHLEKPGLINWEGAVINGPEKLKQGELEMFSDFFEQVQGEPLTEAQLNAIKATIEEARSEAVS